MKNDDTTARLPVISFAVVRTRSASFNVFQRHSAWLLCMLSWYGPRQFEVARQTFRTKSQQGFAGAYAFAPSMAEDFWNEPPSIELHNAPAEAEPIERSLGSTPRNTHVLIHMARTERMAFQRAERFSFGGMIVSRN